MNLKEEMEGLITDYYNWLIDNTSLTSIEDQWVGITAPFLDRHNDYLQIYARKEENGFFLTDDGYIIHDLLNSGCDLNTPEHQDLLKRILNRFGVQNDDDQLIIHASPTNFCLKKHSLIQAMLAVNDLFYISS